MITRQKSLLYFLKVARRPVAQAELMAWCFLLRHESNTGGGNAFYDFVPYGIGPCSFALLQEVRKLQAKGFLCFDEENDWRLAPTATVEAPPAEISGDVSRIVSRFSTMSSRDLTGYITTRFPEYEHSDRQDPRTERQTAVFTVGYEGASVDAFLNLLLHNGIKRIIDVRRNPIARRYGFHKSTLMQLCSRLDIHYVHVPDLGIESQKRRCLETFEDYVKLLNEYSRTTLKNKQSQVLAVSDLAQEIPSALVCMERNPKYCHRSRLAKKVASILNVPVSHLSVNG